MQLEDLYRAASKRASFQKERMGQALFNELAKSRPDLSEQIRGTDKDPFYHYSWSDQYRRFEEWLKQNW